MHGPDCTAGSRLLPSALPAFLPLQGKWRWLKRPTGIRFKVKDPNWTSGARDEIDKIK